MKSLLFFLAAGVLAVSLGQAPVPAQTDIKAFVGYWLGTLQVDGASLRLLIRVETDASGQLRGGLTSLDQTTAERPADTARIDGGELQLEFAAVSASMRLRPDGQGRLTGTFTQRGQPFPMTFDRTAGRPVTRRPQTPVPPFPYATEDVTFDNVAAGIRFAGTLTTPRTAGRHRAVVLISGSGAQDRDETLFEHKPFLVLADALTRRGVAVLRVDDRGVGGSGRGSVEATSEDFAGDVLAAIAFLKTRREIDPGRIGLIGHSEGGLIAPLVATRSRDVAFIVMLAGPGLPGAEITVLQVRATQIAAGVPANTVEFSMRIQKRVMDVLITETDEAVVRKKVDDVLAEELTKVGAASALAAARQTMAPEITKALQPWSRFFLVYDPRPTLQKVTVPVLALNGEKDVQVPATENLAAIEAALKAGGNTRARIVRLPSLNHLFQTATTGGVGEYRTIEETFAPAALTLIGDWIIAL